MTRNLTLGVAAVAMALGTATVASAQFPQPLRNSFPFPRQQPVQLPQQFPQQQFPQQQFPQQQFPQPLPPPIVGHHHHHYHVMYRDCAHSPWTLFGTYEHDRTAHRIEHMLEHRGYQAKVVHH